MIVLSCAVRYHASTFYCSANIALLLALSADAATRAIGREMLFSRIPKYTTLTAVRGNHLVPHSVPCLLFPSFSELLVSRKDRTCRKMGNIDTSDVRFLRLRSWSTQTWVKEIEDDLRHVELTTCGTKEYNFKVYSFSYTTSALDTWTKQLIRSMFRSDPHLRHRCHMRSWRDHVDYDEYVRVRYGQVLCRFYMACHEGQ